MFFYRLCRREEGFTLVELMVVLLILGILVGIATASFIFSVTASKETACKSNLKIVRGAVSRYYSANDEYPASLNDLVPDFIENEAGLICPESGETYQYDSVTGEVRCPYHTDY